MEPISPKHITVTDPFWAAGGGGGWGAGGPPPRKKGGGGGGGGGGGEFVKMIFVSFLNSNIYPLKNLPTSRVCIFLETPYSKASSHFPIASHLQ